MSKLSKGLFLVAFGMVAVIAIVQSLMTLPWLNLFSVLLVVAAALVIAGIVIDRKFYGRILSSRSSKHGMNLGATIVIALVIVVCVNYLVNRHGKTWDFTQEKLNSLSDQSIDLTRGLNEDVQVTVFNGPKASPQIVSNIKKILKMFEENSNHFKVRYFNQYTDPAIASKYLSTLQDQGTENTFVFAELGAKRVRVEPPFDESRFVSALIRLTRSGSSKVYFLTGHGERDIESEMGVRDYVKSLQESSFAVEPLNLAVKKEIPKDTGALVIAGPTVPYAEWELKLFREYAEQGGRFLIALDPGLRSNLSGFVRSLGVEFENNYVVTLNPKLEGTGTGTIDSADFNALSDVTKSLRNVQIPSTFVGVSELRPAPDLPKTIQVQDLVTTDRSTFSVRDIGVPVTERPEQRSMTIAMESRGKFDEKATKEFYAVIFGDSDFIANLDLARGLNRDLGMNAVAALTEQRDLVSIRPKLPSGTMVTMTRFTAWCVVLLCVLLPISMLIAAGIVWFRRRGT